MGTSSNELDQEKERNDKYQSIQNNELDKDYIKQLNPDNYCDSIYTEALPIIMEQAKYSLCKIITKKGGQEQAFYVRYHSLIHLLYYQFLLLVIMF